ncbi:ATP-binding protein [Nonomuraea sp. NN258]|nr:ATP-binding protein [Nonomuraea antri]
MSSITLARRLTRRALAECGYGGYHEDVLLVVSELVTNALVHGEGPPLLRVSGDRVRVRVEVGDAGVDVPEPREPGPAHGWGLHVIKLLCSGWGVAHKDEGKVVWCELGAPFAPATSPAAFPGTGG